MSGVEMTSVAGSNKVGFTTTSQVNEEEVGSRNGSLSKTTDFQLARVGKRAVLKQNFGFFSMLSLSANTMNTWEGIVVLFALNFDNGGYTGSFVGFWIAFLGTLCMTISMAEMVSMAPTAGGQYHWVAILSPKKYKNILSYVTSWLTMINWQASVAASGYANASLIQTMATIGSPSYNPEPWHLPFIMWAWTMIGLFFNTYGGKFLPHIEGGTMVLHVLGFFATMIPLALWGPKGDASVVFNTWYNQGGWSNQGLAFLVGLLGPAYSFSGADSAAHLVEEVDNAAVKVPRAMVYGVLINGLMGFGMLILLLFILGDPNAVLNSDFPYPGFQIYLQAVQNIPGTLVLIAIILLTGIGCIATYIATASRATWSFSRDKGMPGYKTFVKLNTRTNLPLYTVALTLIIVLILSLIAFGSSVAFYNIVSLTVCSSFATYVLGNGLLLWRRLTGYIRPYNPHDAEITNTTETGLTWGPWKLPEPLGIFCNAVGILYCIIIFIFSFFPTSSQDSGDLNVTTMNWSAFMFGVTMIGSLSWYAIFGHKVYDGPTVEIEVNGGAAVFNFNDDKKRDLSE